MLKPFDLCPYLAQFFNYMGNFIEKLLLNRSTSFTLNEIPESVNNLPNSFTLVEDDLFKTIAPINPVTGYRDNVLSRLFSPLVSNEEKNLILSNLAQVKGKSSPKDLTNEELLALIPPRYLSDPVELDNYSKYINQYIQDNFKNDENSENKDEDVAEPSSQPSSQSEPSSNSSDTGV